MATPPKIPGIGAFVDKDPEKARPKAPLPILSAAWLLVAGAVVQVYASIIAIIYAASPDRMAMVIAQVESMGENAPSVESARNMGILTVVVAGIATALAYLLFARYIHKGRMWARTAAAVLMVLTLIQLVGITFPDGWTIVAQLLLGVPAVALCYLGVSKDFFAAVKNANS